MDLLLVAVEEVHLVFGSMDEVDLVLVAVDKVDLVLRSVDEVRPPPPGPWMSLTSSKDLATRFTSSSTATMRSTLAMASTTRSISSTAIAWRPCNGLDGSSTTLWP